VIGMAAELESAVARLASSGVEAARFDAEVLLADVLGVDRARLFVDRDRALDGTERARFEDLVARRGRREPLQQLRGRQEFFSRNFFVDRHVLVPRPETETLVETAIAAALAMPRRGLRILDIGTGCGAIAVTLALELAEALVFAGDVSAEALRVARRNASTHGGRVEFREGDLCAPFASERFDLVVANPPYVPSGAIAALAPEVRDHEPRIALDGGEDGLEFYRRLAHDASSLLDDDGEILVEVGHGQSAAVLDIFASWGLRPVDVHRDLAGIERVVRVRRG
jgi:release factor glutamine methyltransferase